MKEDLTAIFREEASELIDKFGQLAESLSAASAEERQAILAELCRMVHNLKGAARTIEYKSIETVTHRIEADLEPFVSDPASLPATVITQLIEATATLQLLLEKESADAPKLETGQPQRECGEETSPSREKPSIRVDTARFDALMGFSGELLMSRARMEERHHRLKALAETLEKRVADRASEGSFLDRVMDEVHELIQSDIRDLMDFGHLTGGITQAMKRVRMVPLRLAEQHWREVVRKAIHTTDKKVDVAIHTGTIELDKHVLDQLRDPMMHLIRNAVDHGLESTEERMESGKAVSGSLEISATLQGAMVHITVRDDGRGVDRAKIREVASRQGLANQDRLDAMSDDELLDLLFHPGFSTAREVSTLSGRGVGLNVVRSRIENLGGRVNLWSPPDRDGTTFLLSVPLSILSTVGLQVRCGNTTYALPLEYVLRTVVAPAPELETMDGQLVLNQADAGPLRIVELSELLGMPDRASGRPDKVVVLSRSNLLLGVLVDHVEGHFEFVAQSMPWNLKRTPGINGASLRPNGSVVVALDVPYLFELAGAASGGNGKRPRPGPSGGPVSGSPRRVLIADDSLASRTMEKSILSEAGYHVTVTVDGEAAWKRLEQDSFDLLVSDVDMPKMNGLELTRRVRSTNALRDLPIILVTNLDSPKDRAAGADAGADEYVVKGSLDQNVLLEAVSKYI